MAIIGINGYLGSGKDVVGKIIQEIDDGKIWEIKKFAGKLKEVASLLTGIHIEKFEDQYFKMTLLGNEWRVRRWPRMGPDGTPDMSHWHEIPMTVREFLQKLGTEAIRDGLHTNAWVNALFVDYKSDWNSTRAANGNYPNWIITDTRFPNEAQAIKDRGGIVIRVNRHVPLEMYHTGTDGKMVYDVSTSIMRHPSETSLDNWKFDYIIENDGSLEDLKEKVKDFLLKMKEINFVK